MLHIGILPLARSTFDVDYAQSKLDGVWNVLDSCNLEACGSRELLLDDSSFANELKNVLNKKPDIILVVQATFTDALAISKLSESFGKPIVVWAVREDRVGGRLRLNSFCGLNLAAHALGLRKRAFQWIYDNPEDVSSVQLEDILQCQENQVSIDTIQTDSNETGHVVKESICGSVIGQIGNHPPGFDTCQYDPHSLKDVFGVDVIQIPLKSLFDSARGKEKHTEYEFKPADLDISDNINSAVLARSSCLIPSLQEIAEQHSLSAISIRCWPECFTEYGGAVCGPVSIMAEEMLPCACESDVYGALSQLVVQKIANAPVFLADLVDVDKSDNSAVVWHCGQAPLSMCDPELKPKATIHSNRKLPLLYEFPLKPGKVTLARISQSFGTHKMVISSAEMLRRPLAFSGTAGVMRMDNSSEKFLSSVIDGGLEHHFVIAYGDFRNELRAVAASFGLPVMEF